MGSTGSRPGRRFIPVCLLALVAFLALVVGSAADHAAWAAEEDDGYRPGFVRTTVLSETIVGILPCVTLPNGETFTPVVKEVIIEVNLDDLAKERARVAVQASVVYLRSDSREVRSLFGSDGLMAAVAVAVEPFDDATESLLLAGGNCGLLIIQRFPQAAFGRASHSSPSCNEQDPVNTVI